MSFWTDCVRASRRRVATSALAEVRMALDDDRGDLYEKMVEMAPTNVRDMTYFRLNKMFIELEVADMLFYSNS